MVELVATVAPSYMQVLPLGTARIGASPTVQATPSPRHVPSSHRYCVPSWQLADPVPPGGGRILEPLTSECVRSGGNRGSPYKECKPCLRRPRRCRRARMALVARLGGLQLRYADHERPRRPGRHRVRAPRGAHLPPPAIAPC